MDSRTRNLLADAGVTPDTLTLEQVRAVMLRDAERFRNIVIKAGLKPQQL
jgi:hypothetical protein